MRKIVGLWLVENGNEESNFNNESNRGTFFCGRHQSFDCIIQLSLFIFYFLKSFFKNNIHPTPAFSNTIIDAKVEFFFFLYHQA